MDQLLPKETRFADLGKRTWRPVGRTEWWAPR
jgi:hypothetical protein